MKDMTLNHMAKSCGGTLILPMGKTVSDYPQEAAGIVSDSRQAGENFVFIALPGARVDGHDFVDGVFEKGALACVVERLPKDLKGPVIMVDNCKDAMAKLAAYYRLRFTYPVVTITGSVGKTGTKELTSAVLSRKYTVHKTTGNYNNEIGLPLTIFGMDVTDEVAVLETGISDYGEMSRLGAMARPDISVITNIGTCHLENLKDRDGILKAKTEIFDFLKPGGIAVLNGDDDKLCTVSDVHGQTPVFFGIGQEMPKGASVPSKTVFATDIVNNGLRGIKFVLHIGSQVSPAFIKIPGEHNVYNALAAATVGHLAGLSLKEIVDGLADADTIDGRMHIEDMGDILIIDDCYNANPVSMKAGIDVLKTADGRKVAILGDMGELGTDEEKLHAEVGAYVKEAGIDVLIAAGNLSKAMTKAAEGGKTEVKHFEYKETLLASLRGFIKKGDTVLVKASHFMGYADVVKALRDMKF